MNDAQRHAQNALQSIASAVTQLDKAAGAVKEQGLKDFDGRALSIARTHLETAEMWLERAYRS